MMKNECGKPAVCEYIISCMGFSELDWCFLCIFPAKPVTAILHSSFFTIH